MAKLKKELDFAKSHHFTQEAIDRLKDEIKAAKGIYQPDLDRLDAEIELVEMAIAADDKAANDLAEERAAKIKAELRVQLYAAWTEAGGSPAAFEAAFPDLLQKEMAKRVESNLAAQDPGQTAWQVGRDF